MCTAIRRNAKRRNERKNGEIGKEEQSLRHDGMRDGMLFGDLAMGYASFGLDISLVHAVEPMGVIKDRWMRGVAAAQ